MLQRPGNQDSIVAAFVKELLNAAVSFHELHLNRQDVGAYAAHKALEDLYDALPDHADAIAEQYQGAAERILKYPRLTPAELLTVEEGLNYIRTLRGNVDTLQSKLQYSELINLLDEVKSTLDSAKYKLLFLK